MATAKKKAAPAKKPPRGIRYGELVWEHEGFPGCCGALVACEFSMETEWSAEVDVRKVVAADIPRFRRALVREIPLSMAITIVANGRGEVDVEWAQVAASTVLEAVGFERVTQFHGNGSPGNLLQLWVYNNKKPKALFARKVEAALKKLTSLVAEQ